MTSGPLVGSADEPAPLRLVGSVGGQDFDQFTVDKGQLFVGATDGAPRSIPRGTRWRLEGDLRANAHLVCFTPTLAIVRREAVDASVETPTREFAILRFYHWWPWRDRVMPGDVAVFLWIVNGQVTETLPAVVAAPSSTAQVLAGIVAFELTGQSRGGAGAVVLLRTGRAVVPEADFDDVAANEVVREMYLGRPESVRQAVAALERSSRSGKDHYFSLLHVAATGGFAEAAQILLDGGFNPNISGTMDLKPLHCAAFQGRSELTSLLLAAGANSRVWDTSKHTSLDYALENGHLDVAVDLLGRKPRRELRDALELALRQADAAQISNLLGRGADRYVSEMPAALWQGEVIRDSPAVIEALRAAGLKEPNAGPRSDGSAMKKGAQVVADVDVPPAVVGLPACAVAYVVRGAGPRVAEGHAFRPRWGDSPVRVSRRWVDLNLDDGDAADDDAPWAIVSVLVETDGVLAGAVLVQASNPVFGQSALKDVRSFSFLPGKRRDETVRSRTTLVLLGSP